MINKICEQCSGEFESKTNKKQFCSYTCSGAARTRLKSTIKNCLICNKKFKVQLYLIEKSFYCSKICSYESKKKKRFCQRCKKEIPRPSGPSSNNFLNKKFCSENCQLKPLEDRFWKYVNKKGPNECWLWIGTKYSKGYGVIRVNKYGKIAAHRYAWELKNGPIQNGLHCLHHCDTPSCVNEKHLWLGTNKDNVNDKIRKNRHPSKLTKQDVIKIRQQLKNKKLVIDIANEFNVSTSNIYCIKIKKSWKHI